MLRLRGHKDLFDKGIFSISPEDGQGLIFSGSRQIPEDPTEDPYLVNEDFTDLNDWTITQSGTGAGTSIIGGICTMTSGTTDNGYASIYCNVEMGPMSSKGPFVLEFRARANYSAAMKQEWYTAITISNSYTYFPSIDSFSAGYNLNEPDGGDDQWGAMTIFGGGNYGNATGAGFTYEDNSWHTYRLEIAGARQQRFFIDGTQACSFTSAVSDEFDISQINHIQFRTYTRGAAGVAQTLEIDWVKFKYGL